MPADVLITRTRRPSSTRTMASSVDVVQRLSKVPQRLDGTSRGRLRLARAQHADRRGSATTSTDTVRTSIIATATTYLDVRREPRRGRVPAADGVRRIGNGKTSSPAPTRYGR